MTSDSALLAKQTTDDNDQEPAQLTDVDAATVLDQNYVGLLPLLQRLDERLAAAVGAAERVFAARAAGDLRPVSRPCHLPADVDASLGCVPRIG